MKLVGDWRRILRKSWAIRFSLLSGALLGAIMALEAFVDIANPYLYAFLAIFLNVIVVPVARVVKQTDISGEQDG